MTTHVTRPPSAIFPENQVLLSTLTEISTLFTQEHVRFWLRGGWALDFLLGRETRLHGDLDLVIWQRHARRVRGVLERNGYVFRDRVSWRR